MSCDFLWNNEVKDQTNWKVELAWKNLQPYNAEDVVHIYQKNTSRSKRKIICIYPMDLVTLPHNLFTERRISINNKHKFQSIDEKM